MASPAPSIRPIQKALLGWYDRSKRDLPWRRTKDPYAIFISEMMLQQTQVKTVIPYFGRFLKELPHWRALAKADEQKVLKLWEGLGYYRRARNLRAAAQKVVTDHQGKLPDSLEEILELPGVGRYSAGAVLSIAFGKPLTLVDGNVIRVFSRLFRLKGDLKTGPGNKKVWQIAEELLSQERPGDFNQALMELGATLCFPEAPQCLLCPLREHCGAAQEGKQEDYPEASEKPENVEVQMAAVLAVKKGKILVRKRGADERWLKGMWEFPSTEGETFEKALASLEKKFKLKADPAHFQEVRHQITHHKVHLKLFQARAVGNLPKGVNVLWATPEELKGLPFSSAQGKLRKKVFERLTKG